MEFIRQLVAFSIMMEQGEGILGWDQDQVESAWIYCANAKDEADLTALFNDEALTKYQDWVYKWLAFQLAAPQEAPTEPEPEPKKRRGKHGKDDKS